jgi:hypothetical protein
MALAPVVTDPTRLERRPEARSFSIDDLLALLQRGRLRIPPFQRRFRWREEDRRLLFDSIARGYPIGTLLLWKKPAEAGRISFGGFQIDAPAFPDALWVVDGQQRLTTLAESLLVRPSRDKRVLLADLEDESIRFGRAGDDSPPTWLPLYEIGDLNRLLEWAHHSHLPDDLRARAFDLAKRIREYQIPAYLVETDDDQVLRVIFRRTNKSGKALKEAEVFDGLFGRRSDKSPSSLREVAEDLGREGFGTLEPELVLSALLTVRGLDPAGDLDQLRQEGAVEAMAETEVALRRAIVFLRRDAGVPHLRLLPYRRALAALALFWNRHPEPRARSRRLLSRWFWRGAISGGFQGNVTDLRQAIAAVGEDEEVSIQRLLREVAGGRPQEPGSSVHPVPSEGLLLRKFNFRHARCKIQVLALGALAPRDLRTGDPLDLAALCESQEVPVSEVGAAGEADSPEHGLAGRIVHPRVPASDLRRLLRMAGADLLRSHGVPPESFSALERGDLPAFFELRERFLGEYLASFLEKRAQWGDSDRPSIAWLVGGDGEDNDEAGE